MNVNAQLYYHTTLNNVYEQVTKSINTELVQKVSGPVHTRLLGAFFKGIIFDVRDSIGLSLSISTHSQSARKKL